MREICPPQLMLLMCEEIHVAVAKEYNPAIQVWYQSLLTRGEAKCSFRFSMRREDAIKAAELAQGYAEQAQKAGKTLLGERQPAKVDIEDIYRPLAEVIVVFYHYVIDTLLRMVGENETEAIARRAMQAFGAWRGKTMREDHEQRGWPLNLESFITYYDDPAAGDAWVAENVSLSPTEHSKDIVVSPYATSFDKIGTGRFAAFYFDEALPAQAAAYNPALTVEIPLLMERGDAITRLHYHLKT